MIYNRLNGNKLTHNLPLYKKYKVDKSIFSPIGKKDFPESAPDGPWLDQADALQHLEKHPDWNTFPDATQAQIRQFVDKGYLILEKFFGEEQIDALNQEINQLIEQKEIDFNYSGRKILALDRHSEVANQQFFRNEKLLRIMRFMLGKEVIPFQTLTFLKGSEQRAHSDSIHMTTFPEGYLIAAWIALEDIQPGSGELFYYPGSHRYSFVSTEDYDSGNTKWFLGAETNKKYEDKIEEIVKERQPRKEVFLAKKGDVLLWHANLLHGGSPIHDPEKTRKSMVAHYYGEGVICYHEMTQRPALMD